MRCKISIGATSVFDRARKYVAEIPGAISGQGGHNQTFAVACALVHGFALNESDALAIMGGYNLRCSPPWTEAELIHKIKSAATARHDKARGHLIGSGSNGNPFAVHKAQPPIGTSSKPIDPATAVENFLRGFRCAESDLMAVSPWKIPALLRNEHFHRQGARLIDTLFEPGELVNIVIKSIVKDDKARPGDAGVTLERNAWESRLLNPIPAQPGGAWLRMNPLDGKGVADANVTAFRFALIEIDCVPVELQLALLAKLKLPISAILTSGGKSAHAWVKVDAANVDDYRQTVSTMLDMLARFGVDGKNKNPSRLSRLPGAIRSIGAAGDGRQRLLYLNPTPKQESIL
jgi:hypothetical protein